MKIRLSQKWRDLKYTFSFPGDGEELGGSYHQSKFKMERDGCLDRKNSALDYWVLLAISDGSAQSTLENWGGLSRGRKLEDSIKFCFPVQIRL